MLSETTITILPTHLRLVHIPLARKDALMSRILDCWWFRRESVPFFLHFPPCGMTASNLEETGRSNADDQNHPRRNDPFFALCHNNVELSVFADAAIVRRCFGEYMRSAKTAREDKGKGKEREEDVLVGEELWVALEITFGGNGWAEAAPRLHALTAPLADAQISILFVSTFHSDYILVRSSSLPRVTAILEEAGFAFAEADKTMEAELRGMWEREGEERAAGAGGGSGGGGIGSGRSTRRSSHVAGIEDAMYEDEDEDVSALVGSLVLSDAGSAGGRGASSERPALSRSNSTSLSRSHSLHVTSSVGQPSASSAAAAGTSTLPPPPLSLLPDELVCVGLSPQHESLWRTKVLETLFYPERIYPRPPAASPPPPSFAPDVPLARQASLRRHHSRTRGERNQTPSPTPSRPRTPLARVREPSLTGTASSGDGADTPVASVLFSSGPTAAAGARPDPPSRSASTALPTRLAPYPVPFLALTQTSDGTSLTADVRLLRASFASCATGVAVEEVVFASGEAGLGGRWEGEDGLEGWEEEVARSKLEERWEERWRRRRKEPDEAEPSSSDTEDEAPSAKEDELEWEAVSPSIELSDLPTSDDDQDGEGERARERDEDADERTLLKCLQLDLTRFGLDKPGLVEHYAQLLISGGVRSLLYQSTYGSANILVAKRDVGRARRILMKG
ncbi:hypothetical protein Rhopal_007585-T1 [Rhodotorula paludigena]|uniref:CASTOR ACT domain-containing protein n=1 Tax=Rhodotorula paludigena TaxID=86838 RepID=A0AAV5GW91_9BASI|nr:hypothetical protein Rhopal_007585-T1 [Rhodotorula paludigena]